MSDASIAEQCEIRRVYETKVKRLSRLNLHFPDLKPKPLNAGAECL
jgi:hypothetical protein